MAASGKCDSRHNLIACTRSFIHSVTRSSGPLRKTALYPRIGIHPLSRDGPLCINPLHNPLGKDHSIRDDRMHSRRWSGAVQTGRACERQPDFFTYRESVWTRKRMRYPSPKRMQRLPTTAVRRSLVKQNKALFAKPVRKVATAMPLISDLCSNFINFPGGLKHSRVT